MVTCPWCGTSYPTFQPNCQNCGGPLAVPLAPSATEPPSPPPAPRTIAGSYAWRLLASDGWWIVSLVLGLLGAIFSVVGLILTLTLIAAFVGIPFLLTGLPLFAGGLGIFVWRYQLAQRVVGVLREGEAVLGKVITLEENYSVSVNGRHPWVISYRYPFQGQEYSGKVSTLTPPGPDLQAGQGVRVLVLPTQPQLSSIYPHP